jgi:hypothetical protein
MQHCCTNLTDDEIDTMADQNSKQAPSTVCDDGIILHKAFESSDVVFPKENELGRSI